MTDDRHTGWAGEPRTGQSSFASLRYCRAVTRSANSSFPLAFRLLPPPKRAAMDTLYAFFRVSDDLADEAGELTEKRRRLTAWREGFRGALNGCFSHPIHPALVQTIRRYGIPPEVLFATLDGVESDLLPVRFTTFQELYPYCYQVASAVGLACVHVWGFRPGVTPEEVRKGLIAAEAAGVAFQLTNILRDLGEDWKQGRVYLPVEELNHFGVDPMRWPQVGDQKGFSELMRFQVQRAQHCYRRAEPLAGALSADGRAIFRVMAGTYQSLLNVIASNHQAVLTSRARVSGMRKAVLFLEGAALKLRWF